MHSFPTQSDEALVKAARAGDRGAFALLVQRYQDVICAIAYSRVGDIEAAHDIAQDALLTSFERLQLLRSASSYRPWLARITRRLCDAWHRSRGYRQALLTRLREIAPAETTAAPHDVLIEREDKAIVQRAVKRLPESLRDVLILHYFQGRSHAQTAVDLGISRAAVDMRVQRAKARMREYLTTEIESNLRSVQPDVSFTKRTLAAVPIGSVCGKLGLDAAKIGLAEALQHLAHAGAQKASTILTGGAVMTSKQVITAGAAVLLLAAGIGTYIVRDRGEVDLGEATAIAAFEQDLVAARAEAEQARAELKALSEEKAALENELERQGASADAAWGSRQALVNELAALETKINEELEKLAKSEEKGEEQDETDLDGKPLIEAMKAMFTGDLMKTGLRMQLPMLLKRKYGKFLDEYVQDPAQRAEVEAILSEMLQAEMNTFIEAFAAYPDMSKLKNVEADQEANKDMLQASLSAVLEPWQMEVLEEHTVDAERDTEVSAAKSLARMAGMKLNEEQMAAFKEIMKEESAGSVWGGNGLPTAADDLDLLATITVGDFMREQRERIERVALRLAEILPPEDVERYRKGALQQIEFFRTQLEMFSGGGAPAR